MLNISRIGAGKSVPSTPTATEMVGKVKKAVQKKVINPMKLLGSPASDLFEKNVYMQAESFWHTPQNLANYARGQYLTEGGKAIQDSHKVGETVIAKTDKLERGFSVEPATPKDTVIYYEKNLLTGNKLSVELCSGNPHRSYVGNQRYNMLYHDPTTGVPTSRVQCIIGGGGGKIITNFAEDGKTVVSTTRIASGAGKQVTEMCPDGVTPLCIKKYDTNDVLVSVEKCN